MAALRNWPRAVAYVGGIALALLILQYVLGLWTDVYAPAQFASFDSGSNYAPSLRAHIVTGDVLFLVSAVAVVLAAISRRLLLIVPAVVLLVSIFGAGEFGMAFVNSAPNDPIDSFAMGTLFLAALFTSAALVMFSQRARATAGPAPSVSAPGAPTG